MDSHPQTDYPLSVWERQRTCGLLSLGSDCLLLKISVQECCRWIVASANWLAYLYSTTSAEMAAESSSGPIDIDIE